MDGPSIEKINILIADDQELARGGLRSFFDNHKSFAVVGEASDGDGAKQLCSELSPDILLLDIRMGRSDGLQVAGMIRNSCPGVRIIIVTMHEDVQYFIKAMRVGVKGYLLKDAPRSEFLSTTRRVMRGETVVNRQMMARSIHYLTSEPAAEVPAQSSPLTAREQSVLALITTGKTNRQIAIDLQISPGTVKVHVAHIIAKLGVVDRTQAAVRALELGLVAPQP